MDPQHCLNWKILLLWRWRQETPKFKVMVGNWVPDQLGIHDTLSLEKKKKKKPCKTNQLVKHKGTHVNETQSSVCVSSWFAITNSSTRCDGVCLYSAYLSSDWQEGNCFWGQPGLCTASHCLRKELLLGHSPRWTCGHYRSRSCWVRECATGCWQCRKMLAFQISLQLHLSLY